MEPVSLWATLTSLFLVGLLGSGHCVGMCGGIAAALGFASRGERPEISLLLSYNIGRILSYAAAGVLVGMLGYFGENFLPFGKILRAIAGILLILMGCYVIGKTSALAWLERAGGHFWRRIQPLGQRFLPVRSPLQGLAVGMVWGWLPCGLVYTALALAATQGGPADGALAMLAFGVGTMPAMLAGGYFSQQLRSLLQKRSLRRLMGVGLIVFGVWTLWLVVFPHSGHGAGHGGGHQGHGMSHQSHQQAGADDLREHDHHANHGE